MKKLRKRFVKRVGEYAVVKITDEGVERMKAKEKVMRLHRWYLDDIYRWAKKDKKNNKNLSYIG